MRVDHAYGRKWLLWTWAFGLVAAFFLTLGVLQYRQNNLTMLELRDKVVAADESGEGIVEALEELRAFVYTHMNASLSSPNGVYPPLQLPNEYKRLKTAEEARVSKVNRRINQEANDFCNQRFPPGLGGGRVECNQNYLMENGAKQRPIPVELYQFDFVSPRWAFDLSGIFLSIGGLFGIIWLARVVSARMLRKRCD